MKYVPQKGDMSNALSNNAIPFLAAKIETTFV